MLYDSHGKAIPPTVMPPMFTLTKEHLRGMMAMFAEDYMQSSLVDEFGRPMLSKRVKIGHTITIKQPMRFM